MLTAILLVASVRLTVTTEAAVHKFDLIEVNHLDNGFEQLILWDWDWQYRRWHCQGWIHLEQCTRIGKQWHTPKGIMESQLFRETWTKHDPERVNRELFPQQYRRLYDSQSRAGIYP